MARTRSRAFSENSTHVTLPLLVLEVPGSGRACLERSELVRQRLFESRPRLAALLVRLHRRPPGQDVVMGKNAKYRGHQQTPRREPVLEIVAAAEPVLERG